MQLTKWKWLQLFADGGDGGSAGGDGGQVASEPGENSAAAGHKRLLELGVPASKLRKNVSYEVKDPSRAPAAAEQANGEKPTPAEPADTAQNPPTEEKKETAQRLTWEQIKADPEYREAYQQETQHMMRERVKNVKVAEENLSKLGPGLDKLAIRYGMDPDDLDYAELATKIAKDKSLSSDRAMERGVSEEVSDQLDQFSLMQKRQQRQQELSLQEQAMQQHYAGLVKQGDALKQKYPGFDLQVELQNPTFRRMTAPGVNLPVEDAYYAVHRKEIEAAALQAATKQTAQQISNAVRSGTMRPDENGASSAPSVTSFDYRTASREQREALKRRIRAAGARGEKIYPGQ